MASSSINFWTGALALAALAGCGKPVAVAPQDVRVATVVAAAGNAGGASYTGVVHARTESNLGFRVAGKVTERLVDNGQRVKRGQLLMRLDPTDFVLATNAAQSTVAAAQARQVQVAADEVRLRQLVGAGAVSTQVYEQAKAAADAANAQLAAAHALARQTGNQGDYANLRADADGVVMETAAEPGQVVAAGQTTVRLARDGGREASINVPESALPQVRQAATAALYADPRTTFPATLRELSAVADPVTRTYAARYVLGGSGASAALGATVTVRLDRRGDGAALIDAPLGALVDKGHGTSVWVVDPARSTVSLRAVQVAQLGEESARISSGLAPGERIVALGAHLLKQGQRVQLMNLAATGTVR